ncbi:MAG: peptide ABC transporter substrate-binding protein [Oscillatoria sp. SIO1A7]|nr:peptide ABC transporter substrate-binding protein [Oscillatoria sp. SIO1A7]
MKQSQGLRKWISLFLISCFLALSCGGTPTADLPPANRQSDRITIGTTGKVRTLDPADAYDLASGILLENMGDRLYRYQPGTDKLQPQLATELPTISSDALTYTIPLRQDVVFHDGTPFNAEAMAFSLRRFMENGGQPSFLLTKAVASVAVTSEYEITIQLKQPFAAFPKLLTFFGTCAVSPQYYGKDGEFKPDSFAGTGPYKLAKLGTDSVKLDIFEEYWGEKPANKGVDIQRFSSAANLYNAFRTGLVDVAYDTLDPNQIRSLEELAPEKGWQAIATSGNFISYWLLNVKEPPLDNPKVRQALAAIVDRSLLIERVNSGQAEPLYSMIPTYFDAYQPVFQERYGDKGNPAKAKELLAEAGYSSANPLKLELWYPTDSPVRGLLASALKAIAQQQLDGMLELELNSVEFTTSTANRAKGVYQTFLMNWFADFFDPDNYTQPFLACSKGDPSTGCESGGSKSLGSFYYSDRANQLIDRQRKELNPEARNAIFGELQELLADEVPYIPLWQNKDYAFAQKGITGVTLNPSQLFPLAEIRNTGA